MLTVAVPKRNKLPNIIVLTPKDGKSDSTEAFDKKSRHCPYKFVSWEEEKEKGKDAP